MLVFCLESHASTQPWEHICGVGNPLGKATDDGTLSYLLPPGYYIHSKAEKMQIKKTWKIWIMWN